MTSTSSRLRRFADDTDQEGRGESLASRRSTGASPAVMESQGEADK